MVLPIDTGRRSMTGVRSRTSATGASGLPWSQFYQYGGYSYRYRYNVSTRVFDWEVWNAQMTSRIHSGSVLGSNEFAAISSAQDWINNRNAEQQDDTKPPWQPDPPVIDDDGDDWNPMPDPDPDPDPEPIDVGNGFGEFALIGLIAMVTLGYLFLPEFTGGK